VRPYYKPIAPGQIVHRHKGHGFAYCEAQERNGARFSMRLSGVTCVKCLEIVKSKRDAAKARYAMGLTRKAT
jgi:hypothetical protein